MEQWLTWFSERAILALNAVAVLIIVLGAAEALIGVVIVVLRRLPPSEGRKVWIKFARWLVAGLTFQLAADLVETSISTTWQTITRVGIVALIRTFLNFFLERDLEEVRDRQRESRAAGQKVSEQKTP